MSANASGAKPSAEGAETTRRDFLYIATGAMAGVGTAVALWPFIDSMNPAADVLALSSIDVDLSSVEVGQRITAMWRSRPVFIVHRSEEEIGRAKADDADPGLIDPATDASRVIQEDWLVVVGVCTHLGCIPLGQDPAAPRGDWGGWFCPCHGSVYDTAGRVRRRPAPRNLDVPPYEFLENGAVRIG